MELDEEIRSRGYWWIVIHPESYIADRVDPSELESVLRRARVQLRGWDFPHIDDRQPPKRRLKSITGATDWMYYREIWRFYKSGQFSYLTGIHEDWADRTVKSGLGLRWGPPQHLASQGPLMGVGDALFRMTEIFAFASKLAVTPAGGDIMHVKIEVHGLKGRMLWVDSQHRWPMDHEYRADVSAFPFEESYRSSDLASESAGIAAEVARQLFGLFSWYPPIDIVKEEQAELRPRG